MDCETYELERLLEDDTSMGMDNAEFLEQIFPKVLPVHDAWEACNKEHSGGRMAWLTPPFCKCQPYGGLFGWKFIGNRPEHKIVNY